LTFPPGGAVSSVDGVPSFIVETYLARARAGDRAELDGKATAAAEQLTRENTRVRFDESIYLAADEICFFVFDAASAEVADSTARLAGLDPVRTVEADTSRKETRER
jgi:hypothetical protein